MHILFEIAVLIFLFVLPLNSSFSVLLSKSVAPPSLREISLNDVNYFMYVAAFAVCLV